MARRSKKDTKTLLIAGAAGIALLYFINREGDAKAAGGTPASFDIGASYKDGNGVLWEVFKYKNGWLEATVMDPAVPTEYVKTYGAPNGANLKAQIDNHALAYASLIKKVS
jgi:hypothetical protein